MVYHWVQLRWERSLAQRSFAPGTAVPLLDGSPSLPVDCRLAGPSVDLSLTENVLSPLASSSVCDEHLFVGPHYRSLSNMNLFRDRSEVGELSQSKGLGRGCGEQSSARLFQE